MSTPGISTWTAALAAAVVAVVASAAALFTAETPVRAEYVPLGPQVASIAQSLKLPLKDVSRVKYGRVFASLTAPVPHSATDRMSIDVQRLFSLSGAVNTALHIGVSRSTGSDVLLSPWSLTKVLRADEFVATTDLERVELRTSVCDERSGETKALSVTWSAEKRDYINYGILAARGGDATVEATFGEQELTATLASAAVQLWGGVDRSKERAGPSVTVNGGRLKPEKCRVQ